MADVAKEATDTSWASSEAVRASMRATRGRDTRPELAVRKAVHARGLRYRVSARPLPNMRRTADLVFTRSRVAVFIDGCYWHGCPSHYRPATLNSSFWSHKIEATKNRDLDTSQRLDAAGWTVVRIWEHEDVEVAAQRVFETVIAARDER